MRYIFSKHTVPVNELDPLLAKQHNVRSDSGHLWHQCGPGRETLGQCAGLYRSSRVMPVMKMVHTVKGGPRPYSAPWYWAPLQLTQVQMESHSMAGQAGDDVPPTMRALSGTEVAKLALTFPTLNLHVNLTLQQIRQQGLRPKLLQFSHVPFRSRSDTTLSPGRTESPPETKQGQTHQTEYML